MLLRILHRHGFLKAVFQRDFHADRNRLHVVVDVLKIFSCIHVRGLSARCRVKSNFSAGAPQFSSYFESQRKEHPMPRGSKAKYSSKQKRRAEHIEDSVKSRGGGSKTAARIAWATVNKESGGGKKSGSGRGKKENRSASRKGGRKGGARSHSASRSRSSARSRSRSRS